MTAPAFTHAVVVKLTAKPETAEDVAVFLAGAITLANDEAGTPVWFGVRTDETTFWVFDAFTSEEGLRAHAVAPFAESLRRDNGRLFAAPPGITWPARLPGAVARVTWSSPISPTAGATARSWCSIRRPTRNMEP